MANYHFLRLCAYYIAYAATGQAASITWVAQSLDDNMNTSTNWLPNTLPGSGDIAIFDSTISGISTTPTENSATFSVLEFNFPHEASPFTFHFDNQSLVFQGDGITGTRTNPTIRITNTNNSAVMADLVTFAGTDSTSGSASIICSNNASLSGSTSGAFIGAINSQLVSTGFFTISSGTITVSNTGHNTASGSGNNTIAYIGASQVNFPQAFSVGNNVEMTVSNTGIASGTAGNENVSVIVEDQFSVLGISQIGDNFICTVTNSGTDSSTGFGNNAIAYTEAAQVILDSTTFGNSCCVTVGNNGHNLAHTTTVGNLVGYLNDYQFHVQGDLHTGDDFSLTVSNTGLDSSTGYGGSGVAVINSNTSDTGQQVLFLKGGALGQRATINITLDGNYSGTNTHGGPWVALNNLQQITVGDSTLPGTYHFIAGDDFSLTVNNMGIDSGQGYGSDAVGCVSLDQVIFYTPCSLGKHASILLSSSGNYSGQTSTSYATVGSMGGNQLNCQSSFQSGDYFTLTATNSGTNSGSGFGNNYVGCLTSNTTQNTQQALFEHGLSLGDYASIHLSNSGTNSSLTSNANYVGSFLGYGKQLLIKESCEIGDDLQLTISNFGFDASTNTGGNYAGLLDNNSSDNTGSQLHLSGGAQIGHDASITLSNSGVYQGNNTGSNLIGVLAGQQFFSVQNFVVGNEFTMNVTNSGISNSSGQNNNSIGIAGSNANAQVEFGSTCTLGNHASLMISNSGANHDTTGTSNYIGYIGDNQLFVSGSFIAGTDLNLYVNNTSVNEGDNSNFVGYVNNSQLVFGESCSLQAGSTISVMNSGAITTSQIIFNQGFDVLNGKAHIKATNQGALGSFGVDIRGNNAGGNADITLSNNVLHIETTAPTFIMGGLYGDSASIVEAQPELIIDTDSSTQGVFAGSIQDFPALTSTLTKTGLGTQTLSGSNTYSGLTTVQEGTLIVNGVIYGDVLINSSGILKGNGYILNTVTNTGTISPGESIGTLIVTGDYINNAGTYSVEVNEFGQSSLINVWGAATLNGGEVVVSAEDSTLQFQQPYTILTAGSGVSGIFSSVTTSNFMQPVLTYDSTDVYLTFYATLVNAAQTTNQYGVAKNLDGIIHPNALQNLLISSIALLPLDEAQSALESLSGFQYTNDVWFTEIATRRLFRRLYDSLRPSVIAYNNDNSCTLSCNPWTTWLETGYNFTNLRGSIAHNSSINSFQFTGGFQRYFCSDVALGLAGSYEYDHIHDTDGKGNRNAGYVSAYGLYRPHRFYGLFDVAYGHAVNNVCRSIFAGNVSYNACSQPKLDTFALYGEMGVDFCAYSCLIQPFLGIQYDQNWRRRIYEKQSEGWGLAINPYNWSSTNSRLGFHVSGWSRFRCTDLSLDVAWNQMLTSTGNTTNGYFEDFGTTFEIDGNSLDRSSIDYALTLLICSCQSVQGYLEISGESWTHANTFGMTVGLEKSW